LGSCHLDCLRDLQGKPEAELAGAARAGGAKCMSSVRPLIGLNFAGKLLCVEPWWHFTCCFQNIAIRRCPFTVVSKIAWEIHALQDF